MVDGLPVLRDQRKPEFTWLPEHQRKGAILEWCEVNLDPVLKKLNRFTENLPGRVTSYLGGDFARTGDLSAFMPMIQLQNLHRLVPFVVELRGMPFDQQLQVLWYVLDRLPSFVGAALDARGLGMMMAEKTAQKYGRARILCIQATQPWYLEHLPPYKAAFEDRLIELPMDADILADHRVPRVIKGIPQIPELRTQDAEKKKRHGDTFIAGALAWHASRTLEGTTEYSYEAAPPRIGRWDGALAQQDDMPAYGGGGGCY